MSKIKGLPTCKVERRLFFRAGLARSTTYTALPSDPIPDDQIALLLLLSQRERERSKALTTAWEEAAVRAKVA
jgi:hypothetical protein